MSSSQCPAKNSSQSQKLEGTNVCLIARFSSVGGDGSHRVVAPMVTAVEYYQM